VSPLRFGAADFIANRPLLCGLSNGNANGASLTYESQATLVDSFERGRYDAVLVPSIEYLRGAGRFLVPGPALVGRSAPGGIVLVSQKPLEELKRIAVGECCRTPVAALRIVLAEQQQCGPASRTRVAAAGAIGVDLDVGQLPAILHLELWRVVGFTRPPMGCTRCKAWWRSPMSATGSKSRRRRNRPSASMDRSARSWARRTTLSAPHGMRWAAG